MPCVLMPCVANFSCFFLCWYWKTSQPLAKRSPPDSGSKGQLCHRLYQQSQWWLDRRKQNLPRHMATAAAALILTQGNGNWCCQDCVLKAESGFALWTKDCFLLSGKRFLREATWSTLSLRAFQNIFHFLLSLARSSSVRILQSRKSCQSATTSKQLQKKKRRTLGHHMQAFSPSCWLVLRHRSEWWFSFCIQDILDP